MALGREVAVHGLTVHTQLRVEARVAEVEVTHNLVLVTNTRSPSPVISSLTRYLSLLVNHKPGEPVPHFSVRLGRVEAALLHGLFFSFCLYFTCSRASANKG